MLSPRLGKHRGEVWEVQRILAQVLCCLCVHYAIHFDWAWCAVDFAGSGKAEVIASQHDGNLNLLAPFAVAQAPLFVILMDNIMAQCAEVPHVERTRPLLET